MDAQKARLARRGYVHRRQVHAVADDAVLEEVAGLRSRHDRAVLLALGRGRAQMRNGDDAVQPDERVAGEVGHVAGDVARGKCGDHVGRIDETTAREVHDADAGIHLGDGGGTNHVLRFGRLGHV